MTKMRYKLSEEIVWFTELMEKITFPDKSIFFRSLISDASNALDILQCTLRNNSSIFNDTPTPAIGIISDKFDKTLTIWNSGIGMTREQVIGNLSTHKDLKRIMPVYDPESSISIIHTLDIGLFWSFLVAEKIKVVTKNYNDDQWIWESDGKGEFTMEKDNQSEGMITGTKVVLYLKDTELEFLNESRIKDLCSNIPIYDYPIELMIINEEEFKSDIEETKGTIFEKPVWTLNPGQVSNKAYNDFYKTLTNDNEGYFARKHFFVEGRFEYKTLLYIPKKVPTDTIDGRRVESYIKLYIRGVFIKNNCKRLVPEYLWFLRGVVDSDDLPLNIDIMNANPPILRVMKKIITRKSIEMLEDLANNEESYKEFYALYKKYIKLGVYEDGTNRDKLVPLLRFNTSKSGGELISLKTYIDRMKPRQTEIYYIVGASPALLAESPSLEVFKKYDYEVLYLLEPIDCYIIQHINSYRDHKLKDCIKEGLRFEGEEGKKDLSAEFESVRERIEGELQSEVNKVIISTRCTDYPFVLVELEYGASAGLERILRTKNMPNTFSSSLAGSRKELEINIHSEAILELKKKIEEGDNENTIKELIQQMYASAKGVVELDKHSTKSNQH